MAEDLETTITGRDILMYLQKTKSGATVSDILHHLCNKEGLSENKISNTITSILEGGTSLGFLERKGSRFANWEPREICGRRRRSRCRRRRRRKIRRRSKCRRRRRRRPCRCR